MVYDYKGQSLFKTNFEHLNTAENYFVGISKDEVVEVYDSNIELVFKFDSLVKITPFKNPNYFKIQHPRKLPIKNGLIDKNKNQVAKNKYKTIYVYDSLDIALMFTEDSSFIKNLSSGEFILATNEKHYMVDSKSDGFKIANDNATMTYDKNGRILETQKKKKRTKSTSRPSLVKTKFQASRFGRKMMLVDSEKNSVLDMAYEKINIYTDEKTEKSAYFCSYISKAKRLRLCEVFNDALEAFIPEGYSVDSYLASQMTKNKGTILVGNYEDSKGDKDKLKLGLIDYNGDWIIKPFLATLSEIERDLFIFKDNTNGTFVLYNTKGEMLNNEGYRVIKKGNNLNRIAFGVSSKSEKNPDKILYGYMNKHFT